MIRLLTILVFFSVPVSAEPEQSLLDAVRTTITTARYTALITVDKKGQPRARVVDPFTPEDDFTVWIATRPVTRKVEQIREHEEVTLYYWDATSRSYVTIMGTARIVDDVNVKRAKRRERDSDRFYPDFPDDYLLIEVKPTWLEAMVPGYRGDSETWKPEQVFFKR